MNRFAVARRYHGHVGGDVGDTDLAAKVQKFGEGAEGEMPPRSRPTPGSSACR